MARQLSFTDFTEFLLVRLYELESTLAPGEHPNLPSIAAELVEPVPSSWPGDAARLLIDRGLATGAQSRFAVKCDGISPAGRIYVEEQQHETTVIEEYRERPNNFVVVSGSGHQVAVGVVGDVKQVRLSKHDREELLHLLAEIERRLEDAPSLPGEERSAYLADVRASRNQITRAAPNPKVAASILEPLGSVAAISELVIAALRLLGVA